MQQLKEKVTGFLKKHGMDHEQIDIGSTCGIFLEEMEKALASQKSSLEMIPTYIEIEKEVRINEPVITIDAGGTNFRAATCYFNKDKKPVLENIRLYPMPGVKEKVSKQAFFECLAKYVDDIADKSTNVGFCFSYPCEIFPNKDGKLIRFSKEIKAEEVIGETIGQSLLDAIKDRGRKGNKSIVILNDTVATLLAGRAGLGTRIFDSYIGFILGTGTNCCYVEKNRNILKNKGLDTSKSQIINIESGGFGKAPRGDIDVKFDKSTNNPGQYSFEKMISGAYLGPLCLEVIKAAEREDLFSEKIVQALSKIRSLDTKDLNDFMLYPNQKNNPLGKVLTNANETDIITLYYLIDRLTERAAKLTAINLSSAAIKSGKGNSPHQPVCIVAEGSTIHGLKNLRSRVEYYLKQYMENSKNIYTEIVNVENATLIGAAIAGLTN